MKTFLPISLGIAILAAWLASPLPDGLDQVAIRLGFESRAVEGTGPLAGYTLGWLGGSPWSTLLAGLLGLIMVSGIFWLGRLLFRRKK